MPITVQRICRHPVKGLSAEALDAVELAPGAGLPDDRRFALARPATQFDPDTPRWLPKTSFFMLMCHERLAALATRFDAASGVLSITRGGREVARGRITEPVGRAIVEDFFAAYLGGAGGDKPRLIEAPSGHMFSDHQDQVVSLINLATARDLERIVGAPVDPLRFRANLYVEGAEAWAEFGWLGGEIAIGRARLRVTARIDRCAATNVDPATGTRDMNIPKALMRGFGHGDCGVFAKVVKGGAIAVGDALAPPA
jgi:uncharacterized protein YcbX